MARIPSLFCILMAFWTLPSWAVGTLRCGSHIVDEGYLAAEVVARCGEPVYRDHWAASQPAGQNYRAEMEEWYYNFGSSQLLRVLRFRNGRVAEIDSDGYGFDTEAPGRCAPNDIRPGISKYRLLHQCGEPVQRKATHLLTPLRSRRTMNQLYNPHPTRDEYFSAVYREEWIYNFGSRYLMRIVKLNDGRVTDVENGDRGFD